MLHIIPLSHESFTFMPSFCRQYLVFKASDGALILLKLQQTTIHALVRYLASCRQHTNLVRLEKSAPVCHLWVIF